MPCLSLYFNRIEPSFGEPEKGIWYHFEEDCETRTLDMHIKSIRKKLALYTDDVYIETVRGIGFVINGNTL